MSFVMLTDSQVVPPQAMGTGEDKSKSKSRSRKTNGTAEEIPEGEKPSLSQQIESTTRLFEILSARSDIDHPICTECTDLLLSQLQSRLSSATKERDTYIAFAKSLNSTAPSTADLAKAQKSSPKPVPPTQKPSPNSWLLKRRKRPWTPKSPPRS